MILINGIQIREELLKKYKQEIKNNNYNIKLIIIQVGNKEESNIYIKNKLKYTEMVGIKSEYIFLEESTEEELINLIKELNNKEEVTGIILQHPTPSNIDFMKCARIISKDKDIDCLTDENLLKIRNNSFNILPCTVKAILEIFNYYNIDIEGKNIVIIGRSNIIGRPLLDVLINRNSTVTICHSKTKDLKDFTKQADIIISAVGKPNIITEDMVKEGFIGIDVGFNKVDKKILGDIDKKAYNKASYITPVPGGVGPITVAMVIENLIELKRRSSK